MSNLSKTEILCNVDNGIEFYTIKDSGKSGMSESGLALLAEIPRSTLYDLEKSLKSNAGKTVHECLKPFLSQDLVLPTPAPSVNGKGVSRLKIYTSDYCSAILAYQALKGNQQALKNLIRFTTRGIDAVIQEITGWVKPEQNERITFEEALIYLLPEAPTEWKERYNKIFWEQLERLTGWKRTYGCCAGFLNKHIYDHFPNEVRGRLNLINPIQTETGKRKNKQHQHFEGDLLKALEQHIFTVIQFMQASQSLQDFEQLMNARFNKTYQMKLF